MADDDDSKEEAPAWARRLVEASRKRTRELEAALNAARDDVVQLREKAAEIIAENEDLHSKLEKAVREQTPAPVAKDDDVEERVEILQSENALLVEETATLQAEAQRLGTELIKSEERGLAMQEKLTSLEKGEQDLELKLRKEKETNDVAQQRYLAKTSELAASQAKIREFQGSAAETQKKIDELREALEEKSQAAVELGQRLETESDDMWSKVQASVARARELQEAAAKATHDLEIEKERGRNDKRELESCKADNAGMLKVMSGMERQLASYAAREAGIAASTKEAREAAETAKAERDAVKARVDVLQRDLAHERHLRKEDAAVRAVQVEAALAKAQNDFSETLKERDADLAKLNKKLTTVTLNAEESERKRKLSEDSSRKFQRLIDDMETSLKDGPLRDFERKLNDAHRREAELKAMVKKQQPAPEKTSEEEMMFSMSAAAEPQEGRQNVEELEEELRATSADLQAIQSKSRDLAATVAAKEKEILRLERSFDEDRTELSRRLAEAKKAADVEKKRGVDAVAALRKANDEVNAALVAQADRHRVALTKLAQDRDAAVAGAHARLRDERTVVAHLSAYDQDLENRLARALADLAAEKHHASKLHDDAAVAQRRAAHLSTQLSRSLAEQDNLLKLRTRPTWPPGGGGGASSSSGMARPASPSSTTRGSHLYPTISNRRPTPALADLPSQQPKPSTRSPVPDGTRYDHDDTASQSDLPPPVFAS